MLSDDSTLAIRVKFRSKLAAIIFQLSFPSREFNENMDFKRGTRVCPEKYVLVSEEQRNSSYERKNRRKHSALHPRDAFVIAITENDQESTAFRHSRSDFSANLTSRVARQRTTHRMERNEGK